MKRLLLICFLFFACLNEVRGQSIAFQALPGNSSSYLTANTPGYVVFGFKMTISGVTNYPSNYVLIPSFFINTTTTGNNLSTNEISASTLYSVASPDPSLATSGTPVASTNSVNPINLNANAKYNNGTYYFYLVVNVGTLQNPPSSSLVFTIGSFSGQSPSYFNNGSNPKITPSSTQLTTSTTYYFGRIFNWVGSLASNGDDWNVAANWSPATVPGATDVAKIGVSNGFNKLPVLYTTNAGSTTTNVGNVIFGNASGTFTTVGVTVNSGYTLNVNGDITMQSDAHSADRLPPVTQLNLAGGGIIKASNLNINSSNTANFHAFTQNVNSSVTSLILSGNIALSSDYTTANSFAYNSTFNLTGGTATVAGLLKTTNVTAGCASTFNIIPTSPATTAVLQLSNTAALSSLSSTAGTTNVVTFKNPGATVEYSGTAQTIYTDANITGLTGGVSYQNIKFSGTGAKTPNAGNLNIAGDFTNTLTNDANNFLTLTNSPVFFNGTAQSLAGGAGTGTKFNNVTFSGNGTKAMASGTFSVVSNGLLTMAGTSTSTILNAAGLLTLNSDASGSASVGPIAGPSITGTVNVQRYIAGGTGRRGYKLMSSPVSQSTIGSGSTTTKGYNFIDIQKTTIVTGYRTAGTYSVTPPTNNFDPSATNNPSIFFYYEPDPTPTTRVVTQSDYKGFNLITDYLPIGNGFLFFFRGDRTANFSTTSIATNATLNFSGNLTQGPVTVFIPIAPVTSSTFNASLKVYNISSPSSSVLSASFSNTSTASAGVASTYNDGLHLIGNPYASAIDLEKITITKPYAITNTGNNYIYMMNNSGTYGAYKLTGTSGGSALTNNGVGEYVLPGQGFFVRTAANGGVQFDETCKVSAIPTNAKPITFSVIKPDLLASTKDNLSLLKSSAIASANVPQALRIALVLDSTNENDTVIEFADRASKNTFDDHEDAYYISGYSQTTFMASYSSDGQPCLINEMGALEGIKTIPLYAEGSTTGLYTMNFSGANTLDPRYKLFLKDSFLKDSLDISANSTYSFNIDRNNAKTYGAARFSLSVQPTNIGDLYSLISFDGVKNTNSVNLSWTTKYEGTYTGFTVQRSIDNGKTYVDLATLQSNGTGVYNYTDANPANATNQYRLVQNTINNVNKISNVVTVSYLTLNTETNKFQIFPNPVADRIQIDLKATITTNLAIKVYSLAGNKMIDQKFAPGSTLSIDVSKLIPGAYIIELSDSNNKRYGSATFEKF